MVLKVIMYDVHVHIILPIHHVKHIQVTLLVLRYRQLVTWNQTLWGTYHFIFVMAQIFHISVVGIPLRHISAFIFQFAFDNVLRHEGNMKAQNDIPSYN